jgi:PAS domain S-box-containing protein
VSLSYVLRTLANVKAGDHLCFFFENDVEHRHFIAGFVRHGLKRNERILYLADATPQENILQYLREEGLDADGAVASGQLRIRTAKSVYARNGTFQPEETIVTLWNETQRALADGFRAMRVTTEMSWTQREILNTERVFEFESRLNTFIPDSFCMMACQYDRRRFKPLVLLEALTSHPVVASGQELYDNFYYSPPEDEKSKRDPLSMTLDYRLAQLADRKEAEEQLRDRERKFRSIFENALEGIFQTSADGRYISVNPALARLYGYDSPDDLIDSVSDISQQIYVNPQRREEFLRTMRENGQVLGFEAEVRRKDGSVIWVSENVHVVRNAGGTVRHYEGTVHNITERKMQARRVVALHAATQLLSHARDLAEVTPKLLRVICESLEWQLGAIWSADPVSKDLHCVEIWHAPSPDFIEFVSLSRASTFAPGTGLPGRVYSSGQPAWITDVVKDGNFPRAPFAAKAGLHGAFAFPIATGREVLGVIEFFTRNIQDPDEDLLTMMGTIGTQVGEFIERKRLEQSIAELETKLKTRETKDESVSPGT